MKPSRPTSAVRMSLVAIICLSVTALAAGWSPGSWIADNSLVRDIARRASAPRFGMGGSPPPPPPDITATKAASFPSGFDVDADGKADPGDKIRYTVTVSDATQDATGVHLTDTVDPNTTFVGGSLVISPVAINETYASVGNMTLTSSAINATCGGNPLRSVTCNDTLNGGTLTGFGATQVTANGTLPGGTVTTSNSGSVVLNADGTFVYNPAAGFEGADTFWYTLTSPGGVAGTDTAQVTINVGGANGMVWFITPTPGGSPTGRQLNPISLDGFRPLNTGAGSNPAAGDTIFLFEGAHPLTATLTLLGTQKFIGQDTTATLANLGAPAPQPGNTYPAVNNPTGTAVSVTSTAAALTLGSGNTLAGFTVGNSTTAIAGGAVGTLSVRDVIINTNAIGLNITTSGTIASTGTFTGFTSVTSSGGANGVSLTGVDGTLALGSGDLNNNTGVAFNVSGGNATITYSGTIRNSGNRQISIVNKTGGTVTFSSAVSGSGTGIFLDNNDQSGVATIAFTGGVTLSTGANHAFTATNGGVVTVTGSSNTLTTSSGTPLNVANTSIGLNGLTFVSISANGASNGIILNTTGTTAGVNGGLTVTGVGTTAGTGGTIQNITNRGASFITARDVSLANMNFTNANTSDNASPEPAVSTGANGNVNAAIHVNGVTNITLNRLAISGAVQQGINGLSTTGFVLSNSTLSNLGNEADEDGIHFFNMLGTASITNTTITSSGDDNVNIQNNSGTANITITGGSFNTGVLGSGLLFGPRLTTNTTITISGVTSDNNFSGGIVADASDTATMKLEVSGSTVTNNNDGIATSCASGSCKVDIHDNTSFTGNDFAVISMLKAAFSVGGTFNGRIHNNPIPVADSRPTDAVVINQLGGGSLIVGITNNTIAYRGTQRPILLQAGQDGNGSLDATITGNNIDIQLDGVGNAIGILAQASITSPSGNGASACFDIGGAGGLRNTFTHSLGGVIAGGDLRVRQRFEPTFVRLPGYGGAAMDSAAAATYLNGRNTVVSASTTTVDTVGGGGAGDIVGPGFSGGAACTQPNVAFNETGRTPLYFARADSPSILPAAPGLSPSVMVRASSIARFLSGRSSASLATSGSSMSAASRRLNVTGPGAVLSAVNRVRGFVSPMFSLLRHAAMNGLSVSLHASPPPPDVDADLAPTLPIGKTVRAVFDVTVNPIPVATYSNQGTVSWTNVGSMPTTTAVTTGDRFDTGTALVSSLNPSFQGDSVTFTATVTPTQGSTTPDGTVQFKDGLSNLGAAVSCAPAPANTCTAQFTTAALSTGTHNISAVYGPGTNHDTSTSNTVVQVVNSCTATPITVTNNGNSGAGSLRQAILDSCSNNTISFGGGVVSPINLTSGQLTIDKSLTITGPGANLLTVQRTSGTARVFSISPGKTVTISGLTIAGGNATVGAGILNDHGTLTIASSTLSGNGTTATTGGAVFNDGSTTGASLTIVNSTLSGNTSSTGGALYSQGIGGGTATVAITNSTISGNTATVNGGGLYNEGSTATSAAVTITNGSITNNHADNDSAGGGTGGGLSTVTSTAVLLRNTIVARNYTGTGTTTADDVNGGLDPTSASNLIGADTGMTGVTNGINSNQVGTGISPIDPRLGTLANNGGPTFTHTLLAGSPALDAGDSTFVVIPPFVNTSPITDQRGTFFARVLDAADANTTQTVDIGSFEADPSVEDIADKSTNEDTPLIFTFNVGDSNSAFGPITASSSNTTLVPNANAVVSADTASSRTLTLTPVADLSGTTTITVTVNKTVGGTPLSMSDTFVLTVNAVNDPPTLNPIANPPAILEDAGLQTVDLAGIGAGGGASESGQTLTVTAISNNTAVIPNPTVTYTSPNAAGSLTYTPVANASGSAIITVTVTDNGGGTNSIQRMFTVNVTAVNDPPTLDPIPDPAAIPEDAGLQTVPLTGITAGPGESGQTLTVSATSDNLALIPDPTVTYTSPNSTGSLSYTPVANANGTAIVTVTVMDNAGGANTFFRTFTVTVNSVNDDPTISDIVDQQVPASTSPVIPFTVGDVETAATALSITATSSNQAVVPDSGLVVSSGGASRTLTLTPVPNTTGTATITVTVTDGNGGTAIDTFVATVAPNLTINDAAVAEGDSGTALLTFTVTLAGSSGNTVSVNYATAQRTAIQGVDYIGSTGTVTFNPGVTGPSTFTVTVNGDTIREIDETFVVNLSGATGGAVITRPQGVGTITNDDPTTDRTAEFVSWRQQMEVTPSGGSLTKSGIIGWNAGASSTRSLLIGDGSVEFSALATDKIGIAGLSHGDTNTDFSDIDFGIEIYSDARAYIIEGGVFPGVFAPYAAGDRFAVSATGGVVTYQKNGVTFYTSGGVPVYPLLVDTALFTQGVTIADAVIAGRLGQPVTWTNLAGVTASGSGLTKTAGTGWNAGAASTRALVSGDGTVEFATAETTTTRLLGFSRDNVNTDFSDIDFGILAAANGTFYVFEGGVSRGVFGSYAAGDRFQITLEGGTVKYRHNGIDFYTSLGVPQYPLLVDTALFTPGATLTGVSLVGTLATDVNFANVAGVTPLGNTLTKTAATGWNAGAVSTRALVKNDGFAEFTTSEATTRKLAGLSHGDTNTDFADIDFGVLLSDNGTFYVFEDGVSRGVFGSYVAGDRFRVSVEAGVVKYRRNGVLFYTSAVAPVYPLLVDTALYSPASTIADVILSGNLGEAVTWTATAGVTASTAMLTKTAAVGWNAGAISTRTIASGDGFVSFTTGEATTQKLLGLSNGNTNTDFSDVDFGILLASNGTYYVFEAGTSRGVFGAYVAGDRFQVAVEAGIVKYLKNGTVFYTSGILPAYPLLVDTALYTPGSTLTGVLLGCISAACQ